MEVIKFALRFRGHVTQSVFTGTYVGVTTQHIQVHRQQLCKTPVMSTFIPQLSVACTVAWLHLRALERGAANMIHFIWTALPSAQDSQCHGIAAQ